MNRRRLTSLGFTVAFMVSCGGMTQVADDEAAFDSGGTVQVKGGTASTGGRKDGTAWAGIRWYNGGGGGERARRTVGGGGSTIGGGGVRLGGGGAGGLAKGGDADAGRGGTARVETCGESTCNPGGTKRDGGPDSGVDAGDARDAADAGDARDAGDASDASSVVSCTVDSDCTWGEISHDIAQSADCMCLYGCPSIAMNVATSARRSAQYAALCEPEHDGAGRLCGIDDCAAPPPIACIAHECRTASRRTGLACATPATAEMVTPASRTLRAGIAHLAQEALPPIALPPVWNVQRGPRARPFLGVPDTPVSRNALPTRTVAPTICADYRAISRNSEHGPKLGEGVLDGLHAGNHPVVQPERYHLEHPRDLPCQRDLPVQRFVRQGFCYGSVQLTRSGRRNTSYASRVFAARHRLDGRLG